MESISVIYNNLKIIIDSLIIKNSGEVNKYETIDSLKAGSRYVSAKLRKDTFNSYYKLDTTVLVAAGITDPALIQLCLQDKMNVPMNKRDLVTIGMRNKVIDEYDELNDYYRMLSGLPPISGDGVVYLNQQDADKYGVSIETPVHLLSDQIKYLLEIDNVIVKLIEQNPESKYLKFMASSKIDPSVSRPANDFHILYINRDGELSILVNNFIQIYDKCREYFMTVSYVKEFSKKYKYYDNFMGLLIVIITVQKLFADAFKQGMNRDFYDMSMIRNLFQSYDVPFFEKLPYDYQVALMKKLNVLLQNKSTNRVIVDLCELLDFYDIDIHSYYLIKTHKLDIDENPVFIYKTITDSEGTELTVIDKEAMYDFYFQKVSIDEENLGYALHNDYTNRISYNEITTNDPMWDDSEELKEFLLEEEFNYVQSKYIGLSLTIKYTKMLFETIYFTRMILDRKDLISTVSITLPKITSEREIKLFDVIVLLSAMISKKHGFSGNILYQPGQIMSIYGFDFKEDFQLIQEFVINNPRYVSESVLDYFLNINPSDINDVNSLYADIRDFNDFAIERMNNSKSIKEYRAYEKLFTSLMATQESTEQFTKSDNTVATTYLDYLQDSDIELYEFVNNASVDSIPIHIEHVINRINREFDELKYLNKLNDGNLILVDALVGLINFFKSFTVDLRSMDTIYIFDSRYYNMLRTVHDLRILKDMQFNSDMGMKYFDILNTISIGINKIDLLGIIEKLHMKVSNMHKDPIYTIDNISINVDSIKKENLTYFDMLDMITVSVYKNDVLDIIENHVIHNTLYNNDTISMVDTKSTTVDMSLRHILVLSDVIHGATKNLDYRDLLTILDKFNISINNKYTDTLPIVDKKYSTLDMVINDESLLYDVVNNMNRVMTVKDKTIPLTDSLRIIYD